MAYPPPNPEDDLKQKMFELEILKTKDVLNRIDRNDLFSGYHPDLMYFNVPSLKRHLDLQCQKCGYMLGDGLRKFCEPCNLNYCDRHDCKTCMNCQRDLEEIEDSREEIDKISDHNTRFDHKYHIRRAWKDNKELADCMIERRATVLFDDPIANLDGDVLA